MAEVFPVIPSGIPAQTAADIGRAPDFCFDETGRSGAFQLVDGAVQEVSGAAAVRRWLELMIRQKPGAVPIYRTDGETQPGVEAASLDRRAPEGWAFAEIEQDIRDTAAFCPAIRTVDGFRFTRLRHGVEVRFTAHLHTDETLEVRTNVGE